MAQKIDLPLLQQWVGRQEVLEDVLTLFPVQAMSATLDRDDPAPHHGDALPPLWHWLYFLPSPRQSEIGRDGHARRGGFLPPVPLPRRMWAGGRLTWHRSLHLGATVRRISSIESVGYKSGRSGDLVFVLVRHCIEDAQGLALIEEHDIVYRDVPRPDQFASAAASPAQKPATSAQWSSVITPDHVLLFRYSALTFNGHRIHYDRDYVIQEEGYPGLVVHGPLIATLLVDLVRLHLPKASLQSFEFRAIRPTFDTHSFSVHGRLADDGRSVMLWATDHEGFVTVQASATMDT